MKHHLKLPKQFSLMQTILLFPIVGLLDLKDDLRRDTIEEFTKAWAIYLFITAFWCWIVGTIIYVICTRPLVLLILGTIIFGIVFLLIGIPRIIYTLANRKPEK